MRDAMIDREEVHSKAKNELQQHVEFVRESEAERHESEVARFREEIAEQSDVHSRIRRTSLKRIGSVRRLRSSPVRIAG